MNGTPNGSAAVRNRRCSLVAFRFDHVDLPKKLLSLMVGEFLNLIAQHKHGKRKRIIVLEGVDGLFGTVGVELGDVCDVGIKRLPAVRFVCAPRT